jgi:hypothetical protein
MSAKSIDGANSERQTSQSPAFFGSSALGNLSTFIFLLLVLQAFTTRPMSILFVLLFHII